MVMRTIEIERYFPGIFFNIVTVDHVHYVVSEAFKIQTIITYSSDLQELLSN